jgi:hypothetical protein
MNRNPRSLLIAFPWFLSVGLGAWLVVVLTSDEPAPAPAAEQTSTSPVVESSGDDLVLARTCRNRLKECGRKLGACRAVAASTQKKMEMGRTPDKILSDPKVQAMVAAEVENALAAQEELLEQERAETHAGWLKLASRFLSDGLGLNPKESRWVGEYVCAVHELSARTGADVASTKEEVLVLFTRLRDERKAILRDLEAYMGPERYQKLRDIGGLGFLGEALGCR